MSNEPDEKARDMRRAVRLREDRSRRWQEEGERPLWRNLSMIGALGWLIVVPTLLGVAVGRWLDATFDTGITFSAALIVVGVTIGGWLAWQRIKSE